MKEGAALSSSLFFYVHTFYVHTLLRLSDELLCEELFEIPH